MPKPPATESMQSFKSTPQHNTSNSLHDHFVQQSSQLALKRAKPNQIRTLPAQTETSATIKYSITTIPYEMEHATHIPSEFRVWRHILLPTELKSPAGFVAG